ncbi:PHP domain-containing protein [Clostridium massiliamazoniense]|uniref:PHP domain-containing protein n=1 Tax=Clostridium massiliamazoniense TaxID=1347366 RepID=UPI0006D7A22D|nr:PHP-associated domain-containing protein [Clostridium massiliamazoniense]
MNIDFHTHGLVSKRVDFDRELFLQGIEFAKEVGLDAILLSEHFNAKGFNEIYRFLRNNFDYVGDCYVVNGVFVFPALEVNIEGKGHVILSGNRDNIELVHNSLEPYFHKESFINIKELLDLADSYNLLKIGAHPFRRGQKLYMQNKEQLKRLDFVDLNAKDIYKRGLMAVREELQIFSNEIAAKIITGSDSHYPVQLGSIYTNLNKKCETIKEIKEVVEKEQYTIEMSKSFILRIKAAKYSKRSYIKQLNKYN